MKGQTLPQTKGVATLLGDPKKAIRKLAWPMIIAMSVQTVYNLVDAIWVAGLGADALAAVGFFFPFFFLVMAIGMGLGMGGGAAVSRMIGSKDKKGADSVAAHTIILMVIIGLILTLPLLYFTRDIFVLLGAGRTIEMAVSYSSIMFAGMLVIFFANVANALLRAEGDAKKAMFAMMFGAGLNIILDPIFIYVFGLGVAGAAWATMISLVFTSLLLFKWYFIDKETYVSITFRNFRFDKAILKDIFKVGIPSSIMHIDMSIMMLGLNLIVVGIGGTDGVAVLSTGWRIATLAILPLLGIGTAVVSVAGAAYGQHDYKKLNTAFMYALKIGLLLEILLAIFTIAFAPQIAAVFTHAEGAARIAPDLIVFLQIMALFYPAAVLGMLSSFMFQGTGSGFSALVVTTLRTLVFTIPLAWAFGFMTNMGLTGVWVGLLVGTVIGVLIAFIWSKLYINSLMRKGKK
jgi:putative MATE family efflux protein